MSILTNQFKKCSEEFCKRIHPAGGSSIMCRLHSMLGADCVSSHNCLGCNFNEETHSICRHLKHLGNSGDDADAYRFYLLRLYLLVERMDIILEIVEVIKEYRFRHFGVLADVRKWANFIKHPGPFLLVHHPDYFVEGGDDFDPDCFKVVIDQEFVRKYYSSDSGEIKRELFRLLTNASEVAVLFPDPAELTHRFCDAIEHFITMIRTNSVYRETLSRRSTYEDYFARETPCSSGSTL